MLLLAEWWFALALNRQKKCSEFSTKICSEIETRRRITASSRTKREIYIKTKKQLQSKNSCFNTV
jgi:hypothetical protein